MSIERGDLLELDRDSVLPLGHPTNPDLKIEIDWFVASKLHTSIRYEQRFGEILFITVPHRESGIITAEEKFLVSRRPSGLRATSIGVFDTHPLKWVSDL